MGGSSFGKSFGKITTAIVDPFGIGKSQFGKTMRKVIDPLNIMDPLNVLPGQGEKWGTWDKNFGGPAQDWLGLRPKPYPYSPTPYNPTALSSAYEKQNALSSQMMGDLLADKQAMADASQTAYAQDLIAKNTGQYQDIMANVQSANQGLQSNMIMPSISQAALALQPATPQNQTTTQQNQFKLPNTTGITFGGT